MRIRSIKPEFWRSQDISDLSIEDRLLFIGLWSYVDDNGVGVYDEAFITADLFAHDLSRDPIETLSRVSTGLKRLRDAGLITLYTHEGKAYLYINTWTDHQRVNNPNKPRYPTPTSANESLSTPKVDPKENLPPGTGEQGSRGAGEQGNSSKHDSDEPRKTKVKTAGYSKEFENWWKHYPIKSGKKRAYPAFKRALKRASIEELTQGAINYAAFLQTNPTQSPKYPEGWLNDDRWTDDLTPELALTQPRPQPSNAEQVYLAEKARLAQTNPDQLQIGATA